MSQVFVPSSGGSVSYPISVSNGGTGSITAPSALTALGGAASGANSDIDALLATSLTLGDFTSDIGFFGTTPTGQPTLFSVSVPASPATYDATDLDFQLSNLVDGINEIITQLQTLGLSA